MKKILYVEDDQATANEVKTILSNNGFEVDIASSGKECMKNMKKHYDLFLLDIMLPDMSGWDLFKNLKKKDENCKCVFLSVLPVSSERMKEFKKKGVIDYITKPFNKEDLLARIKKILG